MFVKVNSVESEIGIICCPNSLQYITPQSYKLQRNINYDTTLFPAVALEKAIFLIYWAKSTILPAF